MSELIRTGLLLALLLVVGCDGTPPPQAAPPQAKPAPKSSSSYALKGVVRGVKPESNEVVIKHEEMPGFMKSMTMPFTVRNKDDLDGVHEGDEVEGKFVVTREGDRIVDSELRDLAVTNPAPAPEMVLDIKDGKISFREKVAKLNPGEAVPDFAVTTLEGKTLKLADLRGSFVVLTFVYTRCPLPQFCPAMDRKFQELASRIGLMKDRKPPIRLLSVSFDPENDTPEALRAHAARVGARPPVWTYSVASHDELKKVAERLGLMYGPTGKEIVHNLSTVVIAPDGTVVRLDAGNGWTSTDLLESIHKWNPSKP